MFDIAVLMSTYNGAKFLREQINSILAQVDVSVQLVVRDDSSTDETTNILREYEAQGRLSWLQGENIGPAASFMQLLASAPPADFYAFADQDDVWLPDKLKASCLMMNHSERPSLYIAQTQLVDAALAHLPTPRLVPRLTFGESQIYAFASGCTMVMNSALRQFLTTHRPATMPMLHDFWTYTVAQAIDANIIFDATPRILYRQHGNNAVGLERRTFFSDWQQRFHRVCIEKRAERSRNTAILYETLGDAMTPENRKMAARLIEAKRSFRKRIALLFDTRYLPGDLRTWLLFKVAVLLNTY